MWLLKLKKEPGNSSLEFYSIRDCIIYLRSLAFTIQINTLYKRIKQAKEFNKFFCRYQEKSLATHPDNFYSEKIYLLVQDYKNRVFVEPKEEEYKKNKVITVNSITERCENIFFSIRDTIKYCETIGIKLYRKSIKTSIMKAEELKGLNFKYATQDDKYLRKQS